MAPFQRKRCHWARSRAWRALSARSSSASTSTIAPLLSYPLVPYTISQAMSTMHRYLLPVEQTHWKVEGATEVSFTWDYDARSDELLKLYAKGKREQWDAERRIDWSLEVDPDDPMQVDDKMLPMYGTPLWDKLSARQRSDLRYHTQAFQLSQFLHGEQGALICASKIVQDVPAIESKFYAATQVMDEARHVEAYRRLLTEKFRFVY